MMGSRTTPSRSRPLRRAHGRRGRGTAELLSHFGYTVPPAPAPVDKPEEARLFDQMIGAAGTVGPGERVGAGAGAAAGVSDDVGADAGDVAVHRRERPPADRGADGPGLAVRRRVLRRPDRLGHRRHPGRDRAEHDRVRQTRPREVRHDQNPRAAADAVRVPPVRPGRPEGRVRGNLQGPRGGAVHDRPGHAHPHQPPRQGPPRPQLGRPVRAGSATPRHRDLRPLADPARGPRRHPARGVPRRRTAKSSATSCARCPGTPRATAPWRR